MDSTLIDAGLDLDIIQHKLPLLARDIVLQIDRPDALARHHGLNDAQWNTVRSQPAFRDMVAKALQEMKGVDGRAESIRVKALYALDMLGILQVTSLLTDPSLTATARLAAFDSLCTVAGINKKDTQALAPSGQPLVVINLGDSQTAIGGRVIESSAA